MLYSSRQAGGSEVFVQSLPKGSRRIVQCRWKVPNFHYRGYNTGLAGGRQGNFLRRARRQNDGCADRVRTERVPPGLAKASVSNRHLPDLDREYDVTPDGQRFLMNQRTTETGAPPITVIVNWWKLLQK